MDIKLPHEFAGDWVLTKIKEGATDFAADYISGLPIMIGVAIPIYALLNMISSKLANLGVAGVFVYGGLVAIF